MSDLLGDILKSIPVKKGESRGQEAKGEADRGTDADSSGDRKGRIGKNPFEYSDEWKDSIEKLKNASKGT